jgi:hypothetical protein
MDFNLEELITLLKLAIETGDITYVQDALDLINESED